MPARAHLRVLTTLAAASLLAVTVVTGTARAAGGGGSGGGSCGASGYPWGYNISCQQTTSAQGTPAASSAPVSVLVPDTPCALYPIAGSATSMLKVCPHGVTVGGRFARQQITTTNTRVPVGGAPAVTPQQLVAWAQNELALPLPDVSTAPPRGSEGLVGLPQWYWVDPGQWHPRTVTVQAGGVWASVVAAPASIQVQPGGGGGVTCPGPGTPYNPGQAAAGQHSSCTYTYTESSAGLPGNQYQVSLTVTWTARWQGAGGAGGALPALTRTTTFGLPVAEAQALNPGTGT